MTLTPAPACATICLSAKEAGPVVEHGKAEKEAPVLGCPGPGYRILPRRQCSTLSGAPPKQGLFLYPPPSQTVRHTKVSGVRMCLRVMKASSAIRAWTSANGDKTASWTPGGARVSCQDDDHEPTMASPVTIAGRKPVADSADGVSLRS